MPGTSDGICLHALSMFCLSIGPALAFMKRRASLVYRVEEFVMFTNCSESIFPALHVRVAPRLNIKECVRLDGQVGVSSDL